MRYKPDKIHGKRPESRGELVFELYKRWHPFERIENPPWPKNRIPKSQIKKKEKGELWKCRMEKNVNNEMKMANEWMWEWGGGGGVGGGGDGGRWWFICA